MDPCHLAKAQKKQHTVHVKLALSCVNVALERLAWHCWHGARGLMNVAWTARASLSRSLAICETQSQNPETRLNRLMRLGSTGTGGSISWRQLEREGMILWRGADSCLPMMRRQWQGCVGRLGERVTSYPLPPFSVRAGMGEGSTPPSPPVDALHSASAMRPTPRRQLRQAQAKRMPQSGDASEFRSISGK